MKEYDKTDLLERYNKIAHKNFEKVHNIPYKARTDEDWEEMRNFLDEIMKEANAKEKEKDG